jgi:hypothetical protein
MGELLLIGAARHHDGSTASVHATLAADRTLRALELDPDLPGAHQLIGHNVGRGFRAAVTPLTEPESLPAVLLLELPVAAFLSGYGSLYIGSMPGPLSDESIANMPADICAGWISDGVMMGHTRDDRMVPTPDGPSAPLGIDDQFHPMPPLAPNTMRRQRLLSRHEDEVWAMFRDTYARPDGQVIVLHEYTITATLEPIWPGPLGSSRIRSAYPTARVLPWPECPLAAASAERIAGHPVEDLRRLIKQEFTGISTCTHLNDLLASLAQVDSLQSLR